MMHFAMQVVRNLPCLRTLPGPLFNALLERGSLVTYKKGETIWSPNVHSPDLDSASGRRRSDPTQGGAV